MSERRRSAGLYIHLPFCSTICPYCDFAVLTAGDDQRGAFVRDLVTEIGLYRGYPATIDSIYLGGGTPSVLEVDDLATILMAVRDTLRVGEDARIFLEANPEDVDQIHLAAWRDLGVRTLSLGVQSFNLEALRFLGRRHTPDEARRSVELALRGGFSTVSVDLIFGLPEEASGVAAAAWFETLEEALCLGPDHVSCYQLTVHEKTPFGRRLARGALVEVGDEAQADLFFHTHARLTDGGYQAYEVSNFARAPEHRSSHNQRYWDHSPYLGLGPSAHSFDGKRRRWWNERYPLAYGKRLARGERPVAGEERLGPMDLALEALMLGLRTPSGVDLRRFEARHGQALGRRNRGLIVRLQEEGLLEVNQKRLVPTVRGLAVADSMAASFELK